jgi:hypothetical protein
LRAKALLRISATGGVAAADEAMADIALPFFGTDDVKLALPASVEAFQGALNHPRKHRSLTPLIFNQEAKRSDLLKPYCAFRVSGLASELMGFALRARRSPDV